LLHGHFIVVHFKYDYIRFLATFHDTEEKENSVENAIADWVLSSDV